MKFVITIAGSDSSSGAGVQEDLKTCSALGVYCLTAITSITAQNTYQVIAIHDIPAEIVGKQIDAVMADFGPVYGKTGMLSNSEIVNTVARKIDEYGLKLVVDPVMISKSGALLLKESAVNTLKKELLPRAFFITPNIDEASRLVGMKIKTLEDMEIAAQKLHDTGADYVVVKGGHLEGEKAVDVLYDGKAIRRYEYPKINTKNTHGAGCTLSSAIASYLSIYGDPLKSFYLARRYMQKAIEHSLSIGHGNGPLNPFYRIWKGAEGEI